MRVLTLFSFAEFFQQHGINNLAHSYGRLEHAKGIEPALPTSKLFGKMISKICGISFVAYFTFLSGITKLKR